MVARRLNGSMMGLRLNIEFTVISVAGVESQGGNRDVWTVMGPRSKTGSMRTVIGNGHRRDGEARGRYADQGIAGN